MSEDKNLKLISVNLSRSQLRHLELLVDLEIYPNRSEAIRTLVSQGIKIELGFLGVNINATIDLVRKVREDDTFGFFQEYTKERKEFSSRHLAGEYLWQHCGLRTSGTPPEIKRLVKIIFRDYIKKLLREDKLEKIRGTNSNSIYGWKEIESIPFSVETKRIGGKQ